MITIKAFYKDKKGYYCKPAKKKFYYKEGETYKTDNVKLCSSGFHASLNFDISDTIHYYDMIHAHYGIVDINVIETDNEKCAGDEITIVKFLPNVFNVLAKYDKTGAWIYYAGIYWNKFDYKLGFQKLSKIDKTGGWIHRAGADWKQFDYKLGFKKLLEIDKIGTWIYNAGVEWQQFNYELALQKLLEIDKTGEWIYYAGLNW